MLEERIEATTTPTEYEKRTYTVSEIQDILGIGRVSAYSLVKSNVFRSGRVGDSIRVSKRSFDAWLDKSGKEA